jgi:chromosome segregation ATPase
MTSKRFVVLAGLLAGALILPGVPTSAEVHRDEGPNHWRNGDHQKQDQDQRDGHHFRRVVDHGRHRHHHKTEKRKGFTAIRGARKEVQQDRKELRSDNRELRKDRTELRRDIRNGASKQEIFQDRQEIRGDFKEIAKDRKEMQQDQARLETTRRELKADLRKK